MTILNKAINKINDHQSTIANFSLILSGSFLIAASAQIRFHLPNTPIPVTMQTMVIFLIAAIFGLRRGIAATTLYLASGILGLPFFAGLNGGFLSLFGPTGGYLLGFILATGVVGWLAGRKPEVSLVNSALIFIVGQLVIYVCGILWLNQFVGSISQALLSGIIPFLVGDLAKVFLASLLLPVVRRFIHLP